MIVYPPPVTMSSSSSSYVGGRCRNSKQRFMKKMTHVKTPKRQVVQWKQTNVQQGVVVVDEAQLSKLIKTEPIEKYYKLDPEPFATGLFANVRRCRSLETGEILAAKFSSRTRYGEDCTQEIHHEIALLSLCSPSPRIVRLHDVFQTPKEIIIVMEFAPGGDMQTIIDDNLVPYESDVVKFIQHVVEGLAYLHHRKIAHLDIKPQNLVMMGDFPVCDVKVCDFEISRVILEGTEIREILGTPEYVAPEILHYEPITLAADLWSLGVTTYVLLTGFSPFGGETDQETFYNISQAQLDFPDELFEDISEDAKDFIRKLLVRDPKARLTAKECLRHRWLANNRKDNNTTATAASNKTTTAKCDTAPVMAESGGRRVGCSSCAAASANEKNLRKYLSKSREALFERVISKQNDPSLRKSTLLSQYNKTRRLCESQMSLVSKSREKILMAEQQQHEEQKMSPSVFNRSRDKLYGLRCLSKSHEVLNLYKSVGVLTSDIDVPETSPLGGILKTLTRATTADFSSLLPTKGKDTNSVSPSVCDKPNEANLQNDEVKKDNDENNKPVDLKALPQCQPLQSVLNFLCNNNSNNNNNNNNNNKIEAKEEKEDNKSREETILPSVNVTSIEDDENDKDLLNIEKPSKHTLFRPPPLLTKQLSTISSEDDPQSPEISNNDSLSLTEGNSTSESDISEEDAGSLERITGDLSTEEDEPRYTVQQLISAYNLHQEIVTKSSIEVTMNATNTEIKLPPLLEATPVHKFPTGPNALRLFIPDIDIGSRTKKLSRKKSSSAPVKSLSEKITENDDQTQEDTERTRSTADENVNDKENLEKNTIENVVGKADEESKTDDSKLIRPASMDNEIKRREVVELNKTELSETISSDNAENKLLETNADKEKHRLSAEITKNYLRSTSMSSDASHRSSGTSSIMTMSLEELITVSEKKSRSNRSSGIASSDGDNAAETWGKSSPPPGAPSTTTTKSGNNSNSGTPRPNRKSFCSSRTPTIHNENQKTRRKSSPTMKPFY